jgi:hypothetical protein
MAVAYLTIPTRKTLHPDYISNIAPCTGIKREWIGPCPWEASTAPSVDEGESYTPVKRDGRRRKPVMDPDDDNDSVLDGRSAIGKPKNRAKRERWTLVLRGQADCSHPSCQLPQVGEERKSQRDVVLGDVRLGLGEWV